MSTAWDCSFLRPPEMTFAGGNELHCITRAIDQTLEERPRGAGVAKNRSGERLATQLFRTAVEGMAWIAIGAATAENDPAAPERTSGVQLTTNRILTAAMALPRVVAGYFEATDDRRRYDVRRKSCAPRGSPSSQSVWLDVLFLATAWSLVRPRLAGCFSGDAGVEPVDRSSKSWIPISQVRALVRLKNLDWVLDAASVWSLENPVTLPGS